MAEKRPGLKYTVLPANHPIFASLKSGAIRLPSNGQLVTGTAPSGAGQPQAVVLQGVAGSLLDQTGAGISNGQIRIVNGSGGQGSIFAGAQVHHGNPVMVKSALRAGSASNASYLPVNRLTTSTNSWDQLTTQSPTPFLPGSPGLPGQIVRLQGFQPQKSVIVGNQRHQVVRIVQSQQIKHQKPEQLASNKPQLNTLLQPRIVKVASQQLSTQTVGSRIMLNSQHQKPQQIRLSVQQGKIIFTNL